MQNCGIGNDGGSQVLEMLKNNESLAIIDLRANEDMDPQLLKKIMQKLYHNNKACVVEVNRATQSVFHFSKENMNIKGKPGKVKR